MTVLTRWVFKSSAVIALLVVAGACKPDRWSESHVAGTGPSADRPECPQKWDSIPLRESSRAGIYVVPTSGLAVPGPNTNIPEFHDCQRFIDSRGSEFEALYAIFAASRLDSIGDALRVDSSLWTSSNTSVATVSPTGVVTAVSLGAATISSLLPGDTLPAGLVSLVVTPQLVPDAPNEILVGPVSAPPQLLQLGHSVPLALSAGATTKSIIAVAQIYTYGAGYAPLGIGRAFSCLYLYFDTSRALSARMVPADAGSVAPPCRDAVNPNAVAGKVLTVVRTKPAQVSSDYPAVARWDYDRRNRQYHIGIACGDAWCEVGAPGKDPFTPTRTAAYDPSGTPEENRVLRVKGWHDQQNLAMDGSAAGSVVPSGILATVVPHPGLGSVLETTYRSATWVLSGYVGMDTTNAIPGAVKAYKKKFNFDPVPVRLPLSSMNTLSFCYGKRDECEIPDPPPGITGCDDSTLGIFFARVWWVKIQAAADRKVMYRCTTRRGDTGMSGVTGVTAPTARWRWVAVDETVWEYCMSHYCCEVGANSSSEGWLQQ